MRYRRDLVSTLKFALLFGSYFVTARIGLGLHAVNDFATLVWPPTGIAIAGLWFFGLRFWPAIATCAFLVNWVSGASFLAACGIGIGNTLEAIAAARIMQEFGFDPALRRIKDVFILILVSFGATLLSATIGVTSLWITRTVPSSQFLYTWMSWWAGDISGALMIAPVFLVWGSGPVRFTLTKETIKGLLIFLVLFLTSGLIVGGVGVTDSSSLLKPYYVFPILMLTAFLSGQRGVVTMVPVLSAIGISVTVMGHGIFAYETPAVDQNLFRAQLFFCLLAMSKMMLAASLHERQQQKQERESDIAALKGLHEISAKMITQQELQPLLDDLLEAAIAISRSQMGNVQIYDPETQSLNIVAQKGFKRPFLEHFARVRIEGSSACAEALKRHARVIVEDVSRSPIFMNSPELDVMLAAGARAVQSTPLIAHDGTSLGIFSTHWSHPFHPDDRTLTMLDLLARETAYLIEAKQREDALKQALISRDEFLSIASHELKTPLTSLSLQIQLARMKMDGEIAAVPSEKIAQVFNISERQINRLTGLIEDLLDASRIQTGKFSFNFERGDLSHVIEDMLERVLADLNRAGVSVERQIERNINGTFDRLRIEQVVDNLLSNVIKYAKGSSVKISLSKTPNGARLVVEDEGPGIPLEKQATIFDRFERANQSRNISGLGLGLFIVKEIVRGHSGSVRLESAPGKGSKFTIDLPLSSKVIENIG